MERDGRRLTKVNGAAVVAWTTAPAALEGPVCPKGCDVATTPEHGGGDQWVCTGCGTQFTWKGKP
jgi:hypothetical protein